MHLKYEIKMVKRVPIVMIDGVPHLFDTGHPAVAAAVTPGVAAFLGVPSLRLLGYGWLKRYARIDYANRILETSDEPIVMADGKTVAFYCGAGSRPRVDMMVRGVSLRPYVDTGAAYSYVYGLGRDFPAFGVVEENDLSGKHWTVSAYRVPCRFDDHPFEVIGADAGDCPSPVPPENVIGYDFFNSFTVVIDKVGGVLAYENAKNT